MRSVLDDAQRQESGSKPARWLSPNALTVGAIAAVAFAARVAWIAYADFVPTLSDDAGRYDLIGRSLADGGGFVNPNGTTTLFWPPGYPFILAAVYKLWPAALLGDNEVTAALLLNAAFGAATVVLAFALGRRAFGERAALLGAGIAALFPSLVFLAGVTLTETAFTCLLLLALWLIVASEERADRRLLAAAGIAVGVAALVRGQALLLPLVAAPYWLLATRDVRATALRVAATVALAAAVVAPWTARNYVESETLVPISSNDGVNFYIGHSPGADGRGRKVDELVFRYPELPQPEAEARISRDGYREGLEYALEHPVREAWLSARKVFFLYWRDDEALRWNEAHGEHRFLSSWERDALAGLWNAYYWAVLALAAVGIGASAWGLARDKGGDARAVQALLLSLVAYWTLVHVAFFADPRFHAPVVPVLALFAGAAAMSALRRAGDLRGR